MWRGRVAVAAVLALALTTSAPAIFMMPTRVPVERLEKNIAAYVKAHPKQAKGYYTLGRVHYLAVAAKTGTVGVYDELGDAWRAGKALPNLAVDRMQPSRDPQDAPPKTEELVRHVRAGVQNLRRAIELEPKNALYHLTLASLLEATPGEVAVQLVGFPPGDPMEWKEWPEAVLAEAVRQIDRLRDADQKVRDEAAADLRKMGARGVVALVMRHETEASPEVRARVAEVVKMYWEERAVEEYEKAHALAIAKDRKAEHQPLMGLDQLVSYEAASHYLALTGRRERSADEEKRRAEMAAALRELEELPPGPITPIVLALHGTTGVRELIDERARVRFDLDGTARGWEWPWVRAGTGILVWDPAREGRITSGRQLFGNVTFGLLWQNGYEAMAALDDDADGALAGAELKGLAVWFDRDGNGVSRIGEVVPIEDVGVTSLRVTSTGMDGDAPFNAEGARLRDGRAVPTYDWVASPHAR